MPPRDNFMDARIPDLIRPALEYYARRMEQARPGFMRAFYLHGSIALGAFEPRWSDIDFIAVIACQATPQDIDGLRLVHREIRTRYPQWEWEGSYLQEQDLGHFDKEVEPGPCYYDGELHAQAHRGLNSVTWWTLKNRGIAVIGPPPQDLAFVVDWDLLIRQMAKNLNTFWAGWAYRPGEMVKLLTDYGIQWAVLGVLRQYYTFRENDITSKTGAGNYALAHLPERWHPIIRTALGIRAGAHKSYYRSRIIRAVEAVRFLRYVIATCNADLQSQ